MRTEDELIDPVDRECQRRRWRRRACVLILAYLAGVILYWSIVAEVPEDFSAIEDHFKYGSIGSDSENGIPYWIWRSLPEMFPEYLPDPDHFRGLADDRRDGLSGYSQFGFVIEPGRDRPIGFSKRRVFIDRVGMNCAVCHVSTVQVDHETDWSTLESAAPPPKVVLGMPANTLDLQAYFEFLFTCASDDRFTTANVLEHIRGRTKLGIVERYFYGRAIPQVKSLLLTRKKQLSYFSKVPPFGPGRVDTFTPYKAMVFRFPYDGTVGTADFPSLWNQRPREGMQLHWDGNNDSVFERNISASIGAGVTPISLDMHRMLRVARWIGAPEPNQDKTYSEADLRRVRENPVPRADELEIPTFPFPIDHQLANGTGKTLYRHHCAECHDWSGRDIGRIVPHKEIGTDRHRLDSYTLELAMNQNTLGAGQWWRFRNFRKTNGYANMPLDGIWARSPYLHNGSVPTLRDLLNKAPQRPVAFYRGNDEFDPVHVGFRSPSLTGKDPKKRPLGNGRMLILLDTRLAGNGNAGHEYGTDLSDEQKDALVEYLKTL